MSKAVRKDRRPIDNRKRKRISEKPPIPHAGKSSLSEGSKYSKHLIAYIIIGILAAIPFSLGKYFEFNYPGPFDSGAYVYQAKHILEGAEIGVEEKPSAKLGTITLNIIGVGLFGFSDTGPKIVQMVLQIIALVFMFIVMVKIFGILPAGIGVIIASSYLSAPFIAKFGNVKEQYMICFMVMGVCSLVMRQIGGRWFWSLLAGGLVAWGPMFKQTGISAVGAVGMFVIVQPLLKHRTWKQTGSDILLLLAGAAITVGPYFIWIIGWNVPIDLPYNFLWQAIASLKPGAETLGGSYIAGARQLRPFSQQWPIVIRYYGLLILPISLAAGSIIIRIIQIILKKDSAEKSPEGNYSRFVLLFALWWLLDMAFTWISPRSYEQYYLPLNASAAMLGGYLVAVYCGKLKNTLYNPRWLLVGFAGLIVMIAMSSQVFFGIRRSPHSGEIYTNVTTEQPEKRNGYAQRLREISQRRRGNLYYSWEAVGEYIRDNSSRDDKIFVWGWYPGIYVAAQRLAPTSWPFTSEMHTKTPERFSEDIKGLLEELDANKPSYIVDSRKYHFPGNRPPLELWPVTSSGLLPNDENLIKQYDIGYANFLRENFDEAEAGRYEAMAPFREFIRNNYQVVNSFGTHILFKLKSSTAG